MTRPFIRRLPSPPRRPHDGERGDVPGWVLITVMTAGLVSALWLVANQQLAALFQHALGTVTGP